MSQTAQDVFRLLGIECIREEDLELVDDSLVKRQYRRLALKLHPDKNKDDPNAELKFNQLKHAHDELMNFERRRVHIQTLRTLIQRKQERSNRTSDKQKFAEDLERRESQYATQNGSKLDRIASIRSKHRMLIEQLQIRRNLAHASAQKTNASHSTAISGGPDDSNMSLEYWIIHGINESINDRKEKADKFSSFISQQVS